MDPSGAADGLNTVSILLVDDTPANLTALEALLERPGRRLVKAHSAQEALRHVLDGDFAVILMDVHMPETDGLQAASLIRQREQSRHTPIIFLTAYDRNDAQVLHAYSLGAVDFLFKPIMPEILRAKVEVFVELYRHTQRLRQRVAESLNETTQELSRLIADRERSEAHRLDLLARERAARAEAESANRLKDDFLATLSHELRTPLNAIVGWIALFRGGGLTPAERDHAMEVIERNARVQARLIDDLLDVSRILSGKLLLNPRPVQLEAVVRAAMDSVRVAAEAKGVELDSRLEGGQAVVWGDPDRLQQVAWNLLSNAVKFTPKGGTVRVELAREKSAARLTVADTGDGIPPDFLPHVFERFRQAEPGTRRSHGGLGLGLAIVRHLVEMHGGKAAAESAGPGKGSLFTVTLPLNAVGLLPGDLAAVREPRPHAAGAAEPPRLDGLRILVVDDELDSRDLVAFVLRRQGAEVRTAASAAEALAALAKQPVDILVSDIGMPEQDGCDLVRKIRASPPPVGAVPAIALTALARGSDRDQALAAGFQMHLTKPDAPGDMVRAVHDLARVRRPHSVKDAAS